MSESKLQRKCCGYASGLNILARKVHCEQRKGWPDLLLIFPGTGETVYVEMKNPNGNGVVARLQYIEQAKLYKQGAAMYICDSFSDFAKIVERHLDPSAYIRRKLDQLKDY